MIKCKGYDIKVRTVSHTVPCLCYCVEEWYRTGKFDVEKARKLGIPRGRAYGRLQKGETVVINGKTITPDMVLGPPRKGRKIVYSGDTIPCESVIELAKDCDVLIHEGTLDKSLSTKAKKYRHSTAREAAQIAKLANAKILFLVHISPRYEDTAILANEMKEVFENSHVATDLLVYDVKYSE
jgi:ribonuclease Z